MHSSLRQKACLACSVSKRGCDKQLPECQRCLDRHLDCVYPQSKRRYRDSTLEDDALENNQVHHFPSSHEFLDLNPLGGRFDHEPWGVISAPNLVPVVPDVMFPFIQTPSSTCRNAQSTQSLTHEKASPPDTSAPWFLQGDTWDTGRVAKDTDCVVDVELELKSFIQSVTEMLQSWVKNGHNSFIHRRLYEKGLPTCLQDAFTTLTTYNGRNSAIEEVVLQIALDRLAALTRQGPPTGSGAECILAHLARVQSLFIYEFIMLFDGSVRVRASAEKQLPLLRQWLFQMWEVVKEYRGEEGPSSLDQLAETELDREYNACVEQWRLWILTESVRRTYVVVECITNVFEVMTRGWASCDGAPMITARSGLWEAESALEWSELSCSKSPILVTSLRPLPIMSQYEAEEVDDLVKEVWAVIVGSDKIQYWNTRKSRGK
ncbi:unnamed protein product [Clonostachys rosea]|uniref:Zn(2)-C6 fungal-type domain-containing protein n=1 Tax=Bionectria ochroleuca TaxID=29856 RepID=A0ABY6V1I2_BIOOC|nr:unnamed protein product [Clonostachys rosea]